MRILIPAGAIAALLWLVSRPEWEHATHAKKIIAVIAMVAVFAALEILAAFAASRGSAKKKRPAGPYVTGKR